jgi:hypothetical protein
MGQKKEDKTQGKVE